MRLYRPVGVHELRLIIIGSDFAAFPPRLAHQPFFYPVLEVEYARQIARDWNTKDAASGYAGFVTRFDVADVVAARYPPKVVGAGRHRELWVPAEELAELNEGLESGIDVIEHFIGAHFAGGLDPDTNLPVPDSAPPARESARWRVHRLDDNGNEFVVERGMGMEEALRVVGVMEARGHKQTYWASPDAGVD